MSKSVFIKSAAAIVVCAVVSIIYFIYGISKEDVPEETVSSLPVVTVKEGSVTTYKSYPVSIEGEMDVEIRPQVEGYLSATFVDEGDYVTKGTPLFKIDDQLYREQYNEAAANYAASEANLEKAAIELEKNKALQAGNVISNVQLRTIEADYKAVKAAMMQTKAIMESARIQLEYTHIKAPVNGLVGRLPFRKGSFITTANTQPLTLLSDINKVRAYFSISEQDYLPFMEVYKKDSVQVSMLLANGEEYPHKGRIDAVNGVFEKNTGAIAIRAEFPNPDLVIRSGNTGSIQMEQHHTRILLIPQESTFKLQNKTLVYLINDKNEVETRVVIVQGKSDGQYVVTGGLEAGNRILSSGMNRVTEGMKITPVLN